MSPTGLILAPTRFKIKIYLNFYQLRRSRDLMPQDKAASVMPAGREKLGSVASPRGRGSVAGGGAGRPMATSQLEMTTKKVGGYAAAMVRSNTYFYCCGYRSSRSFFTHGIRPRLSPAYCTFLITSTGNILPMQ